MPETRRSRNSRRPSCDGSNERHLSRGEDARGCVFAQLERLQADREYVNVTAIWELTSA